MTQKSPPPYEFQAATCKPGSPLAVELTQELYGKGSKHLTWVMIVAHDVEVTSKMLVEQFGFHPLAAEDALLDQERPHLHETADHLFFSAPAVEDIAGKFVYDEIGVFLSEKLLLTVTRRKVPVVVEWFDRWTRSPATVGDSPSLMLHGLLDAIIDDYFPALDAIEGQAESIETVLFRGKEASVKDIMRLKRRLLRNELQTHAGAVLDLRLSGGSARDGGHRVRRALDLQEEGVAVASKQGAEIDPAGVTAR